MKDEWLRAAISDDTIVADLLLRLKQSPSSSSSSSLLLHSQTQTQPQTAVFILKPLPPSWGLRQPRSKPSSTSSSSFFDKKRRSPTTPLSWTGGGASPSEGCDESLSSHHHPPPPSSDRSRSKVSASTEAATTTTTNKRPRRKKTFAELKEEESSLMKERTHLKKELATLRGTLKEQRSINDKLKRMKVDLQVESRMKSEATSVDERNNTNNGISEAASSSVTRQDKVEDASEPDSCPSQKRETSQDALFMLPDLNMVPEEDSIVGTSS